MVDIGIKKLHRWLWPVNCLLCGVRVPARGDLCLACERALPRPAWACRRCAANDAVREIDDAVCGECQKHPPAFVDTQAAFRYATPLDKLIQDLKYHGRLDLSRVLGGYLARHLLSLTGPRPDLIVPVPLHPSRLRSRGYNQSLEIARFVARALELPIDVKNTRRIRATAPQTELPRERRRKNVRGAFQAGDAFSGCSVAVVDDVMTSGHTVQALAQSLLEAGAREVRVWVVARA
ncbi:MAG TPA: ComF family protein [Candidatus Methylomirabilis sp.]|nr:ComF family protein [Candidatus Methylomirabilis sp.]